MKIFLTGGTGFIGKHSNRITECKYLWTNSFVFLTKKLNLLS